MEPESSAEELLGILGDILGILLNPSPARVSRCLGGFGQGSLVRRQFRSLERANLLERHGAANARVYRLTEAGRLAGWGGTNPMERWQRRWDGRWRLVLFDLPAERHADRVRLWRWLRRHRFGFFQKSAWISPDPVGESSLPVLAGGAKTRMILLGTPGPGYTNAHLVNGGWDFHGINQHYQACLDILADAKRFDRSDDRAELRRWLAEERWAWNRAVAEDPFLPQALLPKGYLGKSVWQRRRLLFSRLSRRAVPLVDRIV